MTHAHAPCIPYDPGILHFSKSTPQITADITKKAIPLHVAVHLALLLDYLLLREAGHHLHVVHMCFKNTIKEIVSNRIYLNLSLHLLLHAGCFRLLVMLVLLLHVHLVKVVVHTVALLLLANCWLLLLLVVTHHFLLLLLLLRLHRNHAGGRYRNHGCGCCSSHDSLVPVADAG